MATVDVPDEFAESIRKRMRQLFSPPVEGTGRTYLTLECNWYKKGLNTMKMSNGDQDEARPMR